MGWKTLKDHYRIGHYVQVTSNGICIGSPYIHDLIVIGMDGTIIKAFDVRSNEDLKRYMQEFRDDPVKLLDTIQARDVFTASIPVYTYQGAEIVEKKCEQLGWPNVTHDGDMMYENSFSADKAQAVKWAKENAQSEIKWRIEKIADFKRGIVQLEADAEKQRQILVKLEKDYPK